MRLIWPGTWLCVLALACIVTSVDAQAHTGACEIDAECVSLAGQPRGNPSGLLMELAAKLELVEIAGEQDSQRRARLTSKEYTSFSGIGAIVCALDGKRRTSTAFLVGAFDIAVTVAHTFERNGTWAAPTECFYASAGPSGQIRERIPLSSIKTQWQLQPDTFGQPTSDFAVVRLSEPTRLAQRTMSLTRFAYRSAPVVMVGFEAELGADALKRTARGTVYPRPAGSCVRFSHDLDSRGIAAGAPLIDVRDGVVLGIHTLRHSQPPVRGASPRCTTRGNAMIPMNEWLEQRLRAEIASTTHTRSD